MDKIYEIYERYSAYEFEEILDFYANYDYSQYDGIKNAAANVGLSWGLAIAGVIAFLALTLAVLSYVFQAVGLFKMAKNLGIVAPWLAFIPVANIYMLGRVAQGNGDKKCKFPFGWVLLALTFAYSAFEGLTASKIATGLADVASGAAKDDIVSYIEDILNFVGGPLVTNVVTMIAAALLMAVISYVVLYFVYKVCAGKCAPVYLAVSILCPVFIPFFIFAKRNDVAKTEADA